MKGSEKQIKWANDIIANAYKALDQLESDLNLPGFNPNVYVDCISAEAIKVQRASLDHVVNQIDDASKIIDCRNLFTRQAFVKNGRNWMRANGQL